MKKKILLAMSGGVDSSAAIVLLKEKYDVAGVTFRFFGDSSENIDQARAIAEKFGIKHYSADYCQEFEERVVKRFADSWQSGLTPNVCAICNRYMKFPALFEKADELGCDLVATGHYARTEGGTLKQAITETSKINPKDQSYMLYTLTPEQLIRIRFPLGNLSKSAVRQIAAKHGLENAEKPDSQDICFIPDGDYASYIEMFTGASSVSGDFIDKNNTIIGKHKGHIHYTIGQRRGLGISSHNRLYVIDKNALTNTVTVGDESELFVKNFTVDNVIWHIPIPPKRTTVKTRYSFSKHPCTIEIIENNLAAVTFDVPQKSVTAGQCAVFYDEHKIIGGGIIGRLVQTM